jgi:hypothetical protein
MSALRLAESRNGARPTSGLQFQPGSSHHAPPYSYTTVSPLANYEALTSGKVESIYANLEELRSPLNKVKARYPDPMVSYVPPPEQFSQNNPVLQIAHVPTQSKISLEEAMRYTPPNLMAPIPPEAPVYENIQFYSAHKSSADHQTPRSAVANSTSYRQTYQPVSSNVAQMKTNAYFATQQPLQQMQFNPNSQASLKCKPYSPPYPGPEIQRPSPQRFSQPTPIYQQQTASAYEQKSPQHINKQQMFPATSPTQQTHSAGSSPKIPLATIPTKKVQLIIISYFFK